jgi:RteC protein
MIEDFKPLIVQFHEQLKYLDQGKHERIEYADQCISICMQSIEELKNIFFKINFTTQQEEIQFFKEIKPIFFSQFIYFVTIRNIASNMPLGSDEMMKRYLRKELESIELYFINNIDFIKYYRSKKTFLDDKYYLRGQHDMALSTDFSYFISDHQFSTSHDLKLSELLAKELLAQYIKEEIDRIDHKTDTNLQDNKPKLAWTHSKASLIELIYALQSMGAFNQSNCSVKEIATYFSSVFNIDLSHFYTTYQEIKERKGQQTPFLNSLQEQLQKRISEKE